MKNALFCLAACAAWTACAAPVITAPAKDAVVSMLKPVQREFLSLPRAERRKWIEDEACRKRMANDSARPAKISLAWTGAKGDVSVTVRDDGGTTVFATNAAGLASVEIVNLQINRRYSWRVKDADGEAESAFVTEDVAPRLIDIPRIPNIRDLGGRVGLDGRRVRQGLVYRSGGLNHNARRVEGKQVPGRELLTAATRVYMKGTMGIKTDIDLRTDGECFGMTGSPLGEDVKWVHVVSSEYRGMATDRGRAAFAEVFKVFLDEANYPIDFHCIAGADRTGAVAFILNGLLGVCEEELIRDWEFTAFDTTTPGFTQKKRLDFLIKVFDKYPGATIAERIEAYVLSLGFTRDDIAKFRGIMLHPASEIVSNGGFEMVEKGKTVGWNEIAPKYVCRDGEGRSGTRALCFENDDPKFYSFPGQNIKLENGKVYEFEVWVRTENLKGPGGGATICIEWYGNGKWMGGEYVLHGVKGTEDWTCVRGLTVRIPDRATSFRVNPYVHKGMTGKAWFDDVVVREYVPRLVESVHSSVYRNLAADGDVTFKAALNLDKDASAGESFWFRFSDASGKSCRVKADSLTRECATLKRSVATLAMGEQTVVAELCGKDGACVASGEIKFTRVGELPKRSVEIDRLGRAIVDGKPFFPLGMFSDAVTASNIEIYAQSAFNCIMPYHIPFKTAKTQLDLCREKGIRLIYSIKDVYAGSKWCSKDIRTEADELRVVSKCVENFRDHPALLAWYLNDEMPLTMLPRLVARRDLLERLDPGHPTWIVVYQYTQIREYLKSFDVVGTDPYPIPKRPALMATEWTRATAAGTMGCKPMWQVPQAFDWGYKKKPEARKNLRPPTEAEMRSMSWQCIANGANGLIFYSFHALHDPEYPVPFETRWAECRRVAEEIARFFPVLLSDEKADLPPALGLCDAKNVGESVSVRSWWKDGEAWVLVVNGGDKPAEAIVRLDGGFSKASAEFGAGGELKGDKLVVRLAPLQQSFMRLVR